MTPRFVYFDTSILIPLYIKDKASSLAERAFAEFTRNAELPIVISALTRLEFVSTIAKYVRTGQTGKEQAQEIIDTFEEHCRRDFLMLPIRPSDYDNTQRWIKQMRTSLKTMDGLHMAVAVANHCILVTADKQLAAAATVFDIEHHFVPYG